MPAQTAPPAMRRPVAMTGGPQPTSGAVTAQSPNAPWAVWIATLALCGLAGLLVTVGFSDLVKTHVLWSDLRSSQDEAVGPVLVAVVAAVFVAERIWPAVPRRAAARGHLVDACYLALYALVGPVVTLLSTGFAWPSSATPLSCASAGYRWCRSWVWSSSSFSLSTPATGRPIVANHRTAMFWRFHALHHSQEEMSVFTTFRTHPLAHVSYLPALIPALMLRRQRDGADRGADRLWVFGDAPSRQPAVDFGPLGQDLGEPGVTTGCTTPAIRRWEGGRELRVRPGVLGPPGGHGRTPTVPVVETGIAGRTVPIEQTGDPAQTWRVSSHDS